MMKAMLCIGLLLVSGCATIGGGGEDSEIDPQAIDRAQQTVNRWLAPEPTAPEPTQCRTYQWKNVYGQMETRTQCQ